MNNVDLEELAALDAVGTLDAETRESYLARLADASAAERQAVAHIYDAAAVLASAVPAHTPPPDLKRRVMSRITSTSRLFSIRADEGEWRPTGIDGVTMKVLSVDAERKTTTMLVRAQPGAVYPSHRHTGSEECYVVSGEVIIQGKRYRAGDFHHAGPGSAHDPLRTDVGAEVLLVVETSDYL
jgi:anti-sigma factor ChrR (cupin superfamily)